MEKNDEAQFQNAKMENLQKIVHSQLEQMGLYDKIQELTEDQNLTEEEVMEKIKKSGLLDEIMTSIQKPQQQEDKPFSLNQSSSPSSQSTSKLSLYLKLNEGHSFIDFANNTSIINQGQNKTPSFFEFDIEFFGQRFHSKKIPTCSEFAINETFIMDFNPLNNDVELSYSILKKIASPIHIVILLHEDDTTKIISSKSIEWRWALCYGSWKIETEFKSSSSLNNVNVGTVLMTLSLLPLIDKSNLLSQSSITEQLNDERKHEVETTQDYIEYTSSWWDDYKSIRPSHGSRLVKIFLPTEDRENYAYKPSNCLISPIVVGRAINTPYEAARFVSLIPFERRENPGGEKIEIWHSMHSFLAMRKGDVEDHVTLLCSLLLGFGLDAYIASGIAINGPHLWVITRNKIDSKNYDVVFWESLTGQRVKVDDPKVYRFYKRIHCVFNDTNFYASIQNDESVFNTVYAFEEETLWKSIPKDKIAALPKYSITPILETIEVNKYQIENDIESIIKKRIVNYRKSLEMKSVFDEKLSHLITPALVNYEMERISNITYGNEEFKASVKNYVPEGYTFKAYPFQVNELDTEKIFAMIMTSEIGKDILNTRGDNVTFAVRCKVYPYPQNIYSVWMMIATKYRVIK